MIAKALHGRPAAGGGYLCRCPVASHGRRRGDRTPSLLVRDGDFQNVVVHCFALCDRRVVLDELRRRGLIEDWAKSSDTMKNNGAVSGTSARGIAAIYDYLDEGGTLLYQVVRYEPKAFKQRRPDGHGGWVWNLDGVRRVPYRLPDLFEAIGNGHPVPIVEGEKDVEALRAIGITATCNAGGASKWRDEYAAYFADADVVVIPDNDDPGRKHAECVATSLRNTAAHVRLVELPGLPPKGDVSDWLAASGTAEALWKLVETAATRELPPLSKTEPWRDGIINARDLCSMKFDPLKFIVPDLIPEGLTILAGRPKIGKSWLLLLLSSAVATGAVALGQVAAGPLPQGDVLYLALEDGERRLQRRMTKLLGALPENWPLRLDLKTEWRRFDQGGLDDIRAWCKSVRDPRLVAVDTLAKVRAPGNSKTSPYQNDHDALASLQKLAGELGIGVIVSHHDRKMAADDVFDTVSGTLGLTGAVDTILVLTRKAQSTILHIRGRDIENETSLAMQFDKATCQWSVLGAAVEVNRSDERARVLALLENASGGLSVSDIMAGAQLRNRNAADILLFKMKQDGEIARPLRGIYCLSRYAGKIGKKERSGVQTPESTEENGNLSDLSDLSDLSSSANRTEPTG
jgi:hypothetical protein